MAAEQIEHVIEKPGSGLQGARGGLVEIQGQFNLGFLGLAGDGGGAHGKISPRYK